VCSYHSQCWSLCPFFNWTGDWEAKLWVFILEESSNYNGFILFPLLLCSDPMDSFWNLLGALLKSQATSKVACDTGVLLTVALGTLVPIVVTFWSQPSTRVVYSTVSLFSVSCYQRVHGTHLKSHTRKAKGSLAIKIQCGLIFFSYEQWYADISYFFTD
jgi:hypothetical protein